MQHKRHALGRCEICEKPAHDGCAGLDVPALYFCDEHIAEHLYGCPDVATGRSWRICEHAAAPQGESDG